MVKGLAKPRDRPRHDRPVEYVDAGLFAVKSGYSPMTLRSLAQASPGFELPMVPGLRFY
jgi:hypothetical protein